MRGRAAIVFAWVLVATACGSSSSETSVPASDAAPDVDGATSSCAAGEALADDGHCEPAGIPPSACAAGFAPDGRRGCDAILPVDPCPSGKMAVPGETSCRDVASCADGTWGDVPVETNTQFVDASFSGTSNGSSKAPWKTIAQGISAAAANAIVAIAAGSYREDLRIAGKPVRLWGKCPASVEIVGSASALAAVVVAKAASKSEVRDVAIRGGRLGLAISGSTNVVVDRVWIHDTADYGFDAENTDGTTSASLTRSLVERSAYTGAFVSGADVTIDATVVRDTQPWPADRKHGIGINVIDVGGQRGHAKISGSVVEGSREVGILVQGADATIEATLVRDTQPQTSDDMRGRGIDVEEDGAERANVTIHASIVERSHELGVFVAGSDATIEATVVRDTAPQLFDQLFGRGISVVDDGGQRAAVTIRASIVERSRDVGLAAAGSDVTIESTVVRDTQPRPDGTRGRGVDVQTNSMTGALSTLTLRSTLVDASYEFGLVIVGVQDARIDQVFVRDTKQRASDTLFGDGACVIAENGPASVTITASRIESSARAGLSSFGATVTIGATTLECDAIPLDGEAYGGVDFALVDQGANACGCGGTPAVCQVLSSGLAPPESIGL